MSRRPDSLAPGGPGSAAAPATLRQLREAIPGLARRHSVPFLAAYAFSVLIYSYLFTTPILSNHALPSVWVDPYPSYTTLLEGRWFADIIKLLLGSSGVQPVQMAVAAALQIVNAFLLAALLGVRRQLHILVIALFLAAHPAFLDYYAFTLGHVWFVAGDTLALLGVLALDRVRPRRVGVPLSILCLVLSLATYQPKVALIAVLLLMWCLLGLTPRTAGAALDRPAAAAESRGLQRLLLALLAAGPAVLLYAASALLIVTLGSTVRTHLNGMGAILHQTVASYPEVYADFTSRIRYLPRAIRVLPLLVVALGAAALLRRTPRSGWPACLLLLLLFPPALRASYIVNDETWVAAGRILSVHAYFMVFFIASGWSAPALRPLMTAAACIIIYFFALVAMQAVNATAMISIFDQSKINRIVTRMESVVPDLYDVPRSVVVIGNLAYAPRQEFSGYAGWPYGNNLATEAFADYRQAQMLDFFLGRHILAPPTSAQVAAVLAGATGHRPWPAPDSVYLQDGVVVVLLQPYAPGVSVTWPR
jgi:hypothetical protein